MKDNVLDIKIESIIDGETLFRVLCSLQRVCEEKAAYVAEGGSHGDPSPYLANEWRKVARRLATAQKAAAGL